jgi:hypothetical protein
MMGGTTGRSRDQHVADLLEAAFLDINGVPEGDDLRTRIAFGDRGNTSADDLAAAQLRKLTDGDTPDAALVSATDPTLVAAVEEESGTTEEGEDAFETVAEGDSESADDPIGALIEASPGSASAEDQTPISSTEVIVPASEALIITSESPLNSSLSPMMLDQLAQPVTAH